MLLLLFFLFALFSGLEVRLSHGVLVSSVPSGNNNNVSKAREIYEMQHQKYLPQHHLEILDHNRYKHYLTHLITHRRLNDIEVVERINPDLGSELDYWDYMVENAPFFETPDKVIERAFYFRLFTFLRHIKKRKNVTSAPQPMYLVTEFLNTVPWEGAGGSIACSAGHHFREGRWLHQHHFMESYARFWLSPAQTLANPRQYSFWVADSILSLCKNTGNFQLAVELLPKLIQNYQAIEMTNFNATMGLFFNTDNRDGMEWSISGATEIRGYRPTLNSYMLGEAVALSKIAKLAGKNEIHAEFLDKADRLKMNIESKLWDSNSSFYKVWHYKKDKLSDARELHGYSPWYMNMHRVGNTKDLSSRFKVSQDYSVIFGRKVDIQMQIDLHHLRKLKAWRELIDPSGFNSAVGLTTAEQRHKLFNAEYCTSSQKSSHSNGQQMCHECQWNGPVWPYATSITLTAMANAMNQLGAIARRNKARIHYASTLFALTKNQTKLNALLNDEASTSSEDGAVPAFLRRRLRAISQKNVSDLSLIIDLEAIKLRAEHIESNEIVFRSEVQNIENYLSNSRYFRELKKYAQSQKRKAEKTNTYISWIDENLHPTTGDWMSRTMLSTWENKSWSAKKGGKERGKDYNHSTFLDLIISGLFGFRAISAKSFGIQIRIPVGLWQTYALDQLKYRNSYVAIFWDLDGSRYHRGAGFKIYVDKRLVYSAASEPSERIVINFGGDSPPFAAVADPSS